MLEDVVSTATTFAGTVGGVVSPLVMTLLHPGHPPHPSITPVNRRRANRIRSLLLVDTYGPLAFRKFADYLNGSNYILKRDFPRIALQIAADYYNPAPSYLKNSREALPETKWQLRRPTGSDCS